MIFRGSHDDYAVDCAGLRFLVVKCLEGPLGHVIKHKERRILTKMGTNATDTV